MTRQHRQHLQGPAMHALEPERLLLLTIFGGEETQRSVAAELDRRAGARPNHILPISRSLARLRPAA